MSANNPVQGWKGYVGISEENSYAVPPASPSAYLFFTDESIRMNPVVVENDATSGGRDIRTIDIVAWNMSGGLKVEGIAEKIGHLLKGGFGSVASEAYNAVTGGILYKHVFSLANTLPSYCIEVGTGDTLLLQKLGCLFNSLGLSFAQNKAMEIDVNILGKRESKRVGALTPSFPAKHPFFPNNDVYTDGDTETYGGGLWIDDVKIESVKSFGFDLANGLLSGGQYHGGGGYISQPAPGKRKITAKAEIDMIDTSFYDMLTAKEQHFLKYSLVGDVTLVGDPTGSYKKVIEIEIPTCKLISGSHGSGSALINQSLQFEAEYNAAGSAKITLLNLDSGYLPAGS